MTRYHEVKRLIDEYSPEVVFEIGSNVLGYMPLYVCLRMQM